MKNAAVRLSTNQNKRRSRTMDFIVLFECPVIVMYSIQRMNLSTFMTFPLVK